MKNITALFICLAFCLYAEAGNIKKDSLAFVNAEWETAELGHGAKAMHAKMQMFDSQQSISVIKYQSRKFHTRLINSPGDQSDKTSAIGLRKGAVAAVNGGYFDMAQLLPCVYFRTGGWSILAAFVPLIGGAVVETYKGISKTSFYRDIQNQNRWNTVENF